MRVQSNYFLVVALDLVGQHCVKFSLEEENEDEDEENERETYERKLALRLGQEANFIKQGAN